MPIDNNNVILQPMLILGSSSLNILYLAIIQPYQTLAINGFMLANEIIYSVVIVLVMLFSDATMLLESKVMAGNALIIMIYFIVLVNIAFTVYVVVLNKDRMKHLIKEAKQNRIDEEERNIQEEQEMQDNDEFARLSRDSSILNQPGNTAPTKKSIFSCFKKKARTE